MINSLERAAASGRPRPNAAIYRLTSLIWITG
jgi:hypothetical protein